MMLNDGLSLVGGKRVHVLRSIRAGINLFTIGYQVERGRLGVPDARWHGDTH